MLNMQNVKDIEITEGDVRTIHDKDNRLLWGRLAYDTKYAGNTLQNGTPTPDTPIPVQVATGVQTVTISDGVDSHDYPLSLTGKNLLDSLHGYVNGYINASGGINDGGGTNALFDYIAVRPGSDYTLSQQGENVGNAGIAYFDANKTFISREQTYGFSSQTYSTPEGCSYVRIWIYKSGGINQAIIEQAQLQFEQGSTATTYAPYFASIELCKIGNYQDYIYNSSDDWYVHKAITKAIFNGTEDWATHNTYNGIYGFRVDVGAAHSDSAILASSYRAVPISVYNSNNRTYGTISTLESTTTSTYYRVFLTQPNSTINNLSSFTTWLGSHNITAYYASQTPTDTKITDATLIGQLNAVHEWLTRYGYNATVTGNLPIIINQTNL